MKNIRLSDKILIAIGILGVICTIILGFAI